MGWPQPLAWFDARAGAMLVELGWNTLASAGVALAAWTVLRVRPNTSPRWRLALWTLVFVRLVIPVSASHPFSLRAGVDRLLAGTSATVAVDATRVANGREADGPGRRPTRRAPAADEGCRSPRSCGSPGWPARWRRRATTRGRASTSNRPGRSPRPRRR